MLSLILPARNWPGDRLEACVRSFLRLKSKSLTEIVIVDFGSDEPIALKVRDKRVRIVRVEAARWSLAEAINVGVVASRNPIVAKTDADIVIARESGPGLDATAAAVARGATGLAVAQAIDLPPGLEADAALKADSTTLLDEGRLRARWGQGGLCLFSAEAWNDIGGFESRYHGWGNEDNDFSDRIRRSGRRVRWIAQDAVRIFHVWHPPTCATKDIVKARATNLKIYAEDKSTFRPIRFAHSKKASLPKPSITSAPRPLVTIAFASKARPHRERMLNEAIRGFAGQIDNDFEVLIADNGSSEEESRRLKASLARLPRSLSVRVIDIAQPSIPAARNRLTDEARGRYICIADDDDIPLPTRLADHLAPFEKSPAIHGSHGGWLDFDEITGVIDFNTGGERTLANFLYGRGKASLHPASFLRTDVMRAFRYDELYRAGSDFDLALRMTDMGCIVEHTGSYVIFRRFHQTNITITSLSDQQSVGTTARSRILETLGGAFDRRLREHAKTAKASIWCRNRMGKDRILEMIPEYVGVWRLLMPLSDLRKQQFEATLPSEEGSNDAAGPTGMNGAATIAWFGNGAVNPSALAARAGELNALVKGDVGVVDCGIHPHFYFVSDPIRGAGKALKLRNSVQRRLNLDAELIPEVEYQQRRSKRFDWKRFVSKPNYGRLVSHPIKELDRALLALTKVPDNTALRAMTTIIADFNCTDQLYHLVTAPILTTEGPPGVRRILEQKTGEKFQIVGDDDLRLQVGHFT